MNDKDLLEALELEILNGDDGSECSQALYEWLCDTPEFKKQIDNTHENWKLTIDYNLMFGVWTATITTTTSKTQTTKKDAKQLANWIMEQFL